MTVLERMEILERGLIVHASTVLLLHYDKRGGLEWWWRKYAVLGRKEG